MEITVTEGWTRERIADHSGQFVHTDGLELIIEPRYRSSTHRKRGNAQQPNRYVIRTRQDWFSEGLRGDQKFTTRVSDRTEAERVASEFMAEYDQEREIIEQKRSEDMDGLEADEQQFNISTEAAVEALADAAGYSDELLLNTLEELVGDHLRVVIHRDGDDIHIIYRREDVERSKEQVLRLLGPFPVDKRAAETVLTPMDFLTVTIDTPLGRAIRFLVENRRETIIVLDPNTPVESPVFEHTVDAMLEEKYDLDVGKSPTETANESPPTTQ